MLSPNLEVSRFGAKHFRAASVNRSVGILRSAQNDTRASCLGDSLVQAILFRQESLEAGLVEKIEGQLFSWKKIEGDAAGGRDHFGSFFKGQVAFADDAHHQADGELKAVEASGLFADGGVAFGIRGPVSHQRDSRARSRRTQAASLAARLG